MTLFRDKNFSLFRTAILFFSLSLAAFSSADPGPLELVTPEMEALPFRILTTPDLSWVFKTSQHSLLDCFIRYNFSYGD